MSGNVKIEGNDYFYLYDRSQQIKKNATYNIFEIKAQAHVGIRPIKLTFGFNVENFLLIGNSSPHYVEQNFLFTGLILEIDEIKQLFKKKKK